MTRLVVDANVLASGLINRNGVPGRIFARILEDPTIVPVVSPQIVEEIRRIVSYPRIKNRAKLTDSQCEEFVERLINVSRTVQDRPGEKVSADPDGDKYLYAAREGLAEYIVSGDRHLLDLEFFEGVRIVTPKRFLEILETRRPMKSL